MGVRVEGLLIGSFCSINSQADDVEWLDDEIKKTHNQGQIRTFEIDAILEMAQNAHKELMEVWDRAQEH